MAIENNSAKGIKKGDNVSLDYEGRLEDGEIFDSSKHGDHSHPLEFQVGSGQVIPGFEESVLGMEKGQEKEVTIESDKAYGAYNEDMKKDVPRNALPKEQEPQVGMILMLGTPDGQQFPAKITEVTTEKVTIDLNHPLAGKKLVFKIKVLDINSPDFGKQQEHDHSH